MANDTELTNHILDVFKKSPDYQEVIQELLKFIHEQLKFDQKLTPELRYELVSRFFYKKCKYGLSIPATRKDNWIFGMELDSGKTLSIILSDKIVERWIGRVCGGYAWGTPDFDWIIYGKVQGICIRTLINWFSLAITSSNDRSTKEIAPNTRKEYENIYPTIDAFLADVFNNASLKELAGMYFTLTTLDAKSLDLELVTKRHKKMCKDIQELNIHNIYSTLLDRLEKIFKSICIVISADAESKAERKELPAPPVEVSQTKTKPANKPQENKPPRQERFKTLIKKFRDDVYKKVVFPADFNEDKFYDRFTQRMVLYIRRNQMKSEVSFDLAIRMLNETHGLMAVLPFYVENDTIVCPGRFIGSFRRDEKVLCRFTKNFGYPMSLHTSTTGYIADGTDFITGNVGDILKDFAEHSQYNRFLAIPIEVLNKEIMDVAEDTLVNP